MIPKGLFTQVGMIILAVAIIITYIKPEFTEISKVQDDISVYKTELSKVESVNRSLASLVSKLDNDILNEDNRKLHTYLPDSVDTISVQRDLLLISEQAEVIYINSTFEGDKQATGRRRGSAATEEVDGLPTPIQFTLTVEGDYTQIKNLFGLMEQNDYPLEIRDFSVQSNEGGLLSAEINLVAYEYKLSTEEANGVAF